MYPLVTTEQCIVYKILNTISHTERYLAFICELIQLKQSGRQLMPNNLSLLKTPKSRLQLYGNSPRTHKIYFDHRTCLLHIENLSNWHRFYETIYLLSTNNITMLPIYILTYVQRLRIFSALLNLCIVILNINKAYFINFLSSQS